MTAHRQPSAPPSLPGYRYVRLLGLGGFADVFLYRQDLPAREVAVKVLLAGTLDDEVRRRFLTEANLMAQLSHHPSIVTIHTAAFADDGRPYLVMEYCSRPALAERYRTERMSVAECLRIGVRLASAVQTAHTAGILHRDIKPANVLTTDFGWPALTDFGIAAVAGRGDDPTVGMSIPWAPPEMLGEHPHGDERSDVYSLAATVYSLLAGRSPFEVPGTTNSAPELVSRVERMPLPAIGRPDVPDLLHEVLDRAMAKRPERRTESALAVARSLQRVEESLHLPVTALDLAEPPTPERSTADRPASAPLVPTRRDAQREDATRLRAIVVSAPAEVAIAPAEDPTRRRPLTPQDEPRPVAAPDDLAGRPVTTSQDAPGGEAAGRAPQRSGPSDDDPTRVHPLVPTEPERAASTPVVVPTVPGASAPPDEHTPGVIEPTQRRAGPSRRQVGALASAAVVVVALVVVVASALGGANEQPGTGTSEFTGPEQVLRTPVPTVSGLAGQRQDDGSVVFTWSDPTPQEDDRFLWSLLSLTEDPVPTSVQEPRAVVPAQDATGQVCIEVSLVRSDGRASQPSKECVS